MEEIISEKLSQRVRQKRTGDDEDHEMKECLAMLKVCRPKTSWHHMAWTRLRNHREKAKSGMIIKGR